MTSINPTISPQILFRSLFQFKWLIHCACHFTIRIIYGSSSNYKFAVFFFFSKIPLKVYSKPLELDMKSNDAADSKLQKNSMQRAW